MKTIHYLLLAIGLNLGIACAATDNPTIDLGKWSEVDTAALKALPNGGFLVLALNKEQVPIRKIRENIFLVGWRPSEVKVGLARELDQSNNFASLYPFIYAQLSDIYGDRLLVETTPIHIGTAHWVPIVGRMVYLKK